MVIGKLVIAIAINYPNFPRKTPLILNTKDMIKNEYHSKGENIVLIKTNVDLFILLYNSFAHPCRDDCKSMDHDNLSCQSCLWFYVKL